MMCLSFKLHHQSEDWKTILFILRNQGYEFTLSWKEFSPILKQANPVSLSYRKYQLKELSLLPQTAINGIPIVNIILLMRRL